VVQLPFTTLPSLFCKKCDLLKARVVIYANQVKSLAWADVRLRDLPGVSQKP
jgi:hypothetical protein